MLRAQATPAPKRQEETSEIVKREKQKRMYCLLVFFFSFEASAYYEENRKTRAKRVRLTPKGKTNKGASSPLRATNILVCSLVQLLLPHV